MAVIESGDNANALSIDASKAARVALYDSEGNEVNKVRDFYMTQVSTTRITAALAANSAVWSLKNGATRRMRVKKVRLSAAFDGTAAATTQLFTLIKTTSGTTTGGVLNTTIPSKKSTSQANSSVEEIRFGAAAALGEVGVTVENAKMASFGVSRSVTGQTVNFDLIGSEEEFWLEPNEGLLIKTEVATVIGDSIMGAIHWEEETV